jgi:hypothetical protein
MKTLAEMNEWVEVNGLNAFEEAMLPGGAFSSDHKYLGAARRQGETAKKADATNKETRALSVRAVKAAEGSALWAKWSILVALAALAVAAWPYVAERLTR